MTKESLQNFRYTFYFCDRKIYDSDVNSKFSSKTPCRVQTKPGESGQPGELMKKIQKREFRVCSAANLRSSPREMLLGKGILKICSKFTGEHPC